jgi:transcriptional regulator with XRE-family HTH domain
MDNYSVTGPELYKWRVQNAYSQSQLAKALGVITLTVSRWEREDREIPPFLHLALKSLPKKGGVIRRGRPALQGSTKKMKMKTKKERKVKK